MPPVPLPTLLPSWSRLVLPSPASTPLPPPAAFLPLPSPPPPVTPALPVAALPPPLLLNLPPALLPLSLLPRPALLLLLLLLPPLLLRKFLYTSLYWRLILLQLHYRRFFHRGRFFCHLCRCHLCQRHFWRFRQRRRRRSCPCCRSLRRCRRPPLNGHLILFFWPNQIRRNIAS